MPGAVDLCGLSPRGNIQVGWADTEDADTIASVVKSGFDHRVLQYTVYGCTGISEYIRQQLTLRTELSIRRFLIARVDDRPAGVLDVSIARRVFINYVSVLPVCRHQGIGTKLIRFVSSYAYAKLLAERAVLDVLESNTDAIRWYRSLGFVAEGSSEWWVADLPQPRGTRQLNACFDGYPFAVCSYKRFGFANMRVITRQGEYTVGLLGDRFFRIDAVASRDADLVYALAHLDNTRQLLVLADGGTGMAPLDNVQRAQLTYRMSAPLAELLSLSSWG